MNIIRFFSKRAFILIFLLSISLNIFGEKNLDVVSNERSVSNEISSLFDSVYEKNLNDKKSALGHRLEQERNISTNSFGIVFYKPTYILPYYYTATPYHSIYLNNTPDNQKIMNSEFKAQLSFRVPLIRNILGENSLLSASYTQVNYWQVYAKSQYFRETNYDPELFVSKQIKPNFWASAGIEHQSNGRGGALERSWNRAYIDFLFSKGNLAASIKPWMLICKNVSSDLHNADISDYLGYGETIFSYKLKKTTLSMMFRNVAESKFHRGAVEIDVSYPLYKQLRGYVQVFSGYGQSLLEYNHYTNAAGIGISLSDWI
jgi:phospholipase A1